MGRPVAVFEGATAQFVGGAVDSDQLGECSQIACESVRGRPGGDALHGAHRMPVRVRWVEEGQRLGAVQLEHSETNKLDIPVGRERHGLEEVDAHEVDRLER